MKSLLVDKLIEYFINENSLYQNIKVPENYIERRKILRGLINMREPMKIDSQILEIEDQLLQLELKDKEITDISCFKSKISIWQGDITTLKVDAIVNACNKYLLGCFIPNHTCIDNQIHTYAGIRLRLECNNIMQGKTLKNGEVILTKGYNLPCKYVIQTVGPEINFRVTKQDEEDLSSCYYMAMKLADQNGFKTIVFPCISTGVYGFPKEQACEIATKTVLMYMKEYNKNIEKVIFNVFKKEDKELYERVFKNKKIN